MFIIVFCHHDPINGCMTLTVLLQLAISSLLSFFVFLRTLKFVYAHFHVCVLFITPVLFLSVTYHVCIITLLRCMSYQDHFIFIFPTHLRATSRPSLLSSVYMCMPTQLSRYIYRHNNMPSVVIHSLLDV